MESLGAQIRAARPPRLPVSNRKPGERTVRGWLSSIDKDAKEARDRRIFDLWLACHTQEEIAGAVGCPQQTAADRITESGKLANLGKSDRAAAEHATDFDPPIYNIWKQQTKTAGPSELEPFAKGIGRLWEGSPALYESVVPHDKVGIP